ncbi:hypothetical protein Sa4125_15270 [Aureimonas sp. SA4125]|uniref:hypothetical protein n=1 Tax=Aureimonas sp. SA4125 TaxID=2826993 RepID=UPI001CC64BB5|nr:hypothetical protein [Aureimonas sp. SA4125]BDA83985.1 hypothetical protein Sa4125_15270 [Aureimonas sp. SA4125]
MQLFQDQHEAVVEDHALLRVEIGRLDACAQAFEDVVEARQGQMRVVRENALAVGVEVFGDGADGGFLGVGRDGEWERVESAGFRVARVVADPQPAAGAKREDRVDARGKDADRKGIGDGGGNKHVVGHYRGIE